MSRVRAFVSTKLSCRKGERRVPCRSAVQQRGCVLPGDAPGADQAEEGAGLRLKRGHPGGHHPPAACAGERGCALACVGACRGWGLRHGVRASKCRRNWWSVSEAHTAAAAGMSRLPARRPCTRRQTCSIRALAVCRLLADVFRQCRLALTLVRCMQVRLHQVGLRGAPAAAESAARGPCQDLPLQHDPGPLQVGHPTPVHPCHHLTTSALTLPDLQTPEESLLSGHIVRKASCLGV